MRGALQRLLLAAYRLVFARGLLRTRWGRGLFEALYGLYKTLLEAGPVKGLRAFVPPGSTVIDVGANIGFFTRRFADWAGPDGRVIAIEPEAENFRRLTAMLERRGLMGRVEIHQAVADAAAGTVELAVNPDHPGDHKIAARDNGAPAGSSTENSISVAAVTLDTLAGNGPVALIKIDVQGAELRVLDGAEAILRRDRPALFIEVDPAALAAFGASAEALFERLNGLGFAPHLLTKSGPTALAPHDVPALFDRHAYVDVLFLPAAR
jgi:FkbM family methyltransferase